MSIICVDMETYYSSDFTLTNLSTEQYIRDKRFEVIGCSISTNGKPSIWYPQPKVESALRSIDWSKHSLLAYNTAFDGAIMAWHYGLYPALYLDAMGMARACGKTYKGGSLAKVLETMQLGAKGTYVVNAKGKRYADFTPQELTEYGAYCCNDTDRTVDLYRALRPSFPDSEVRIQDLNLRLFIEPLLLFDVNTLHAHVADVVNTKQEKITEAMRHVGAETEEELRAKLASNPQFAELLITLGVDPPKKLSPTTGLETFAFAKTDPDFVELQEHENEAVQAVVAARLGVKSTIDESRAEAFLGVASRGAWPIQLTYYGANTSRFTSGGGSAAAQNLKRRGKLRDAILPPPGHYIISGDLGAIECRWINYIAEQEDIVEAFHTYDQGRGPDVYCILAEKIFRCHVSKEDKNKRDPAKTAELALGFGGGWKAYRRALFQQAKIQIDESKAREVVDIYRRSHAKVQAFWKEGDAALAAMLRGQPFYLGRAGILDGSRPDLGIRLPNGLYLNYPELRQQANESGEVSFWYTSRGKPKEIRGAILAQNLAEALARLTLTDAWLRMSDRLRIVFHLHDELTTVVPFADVEWAAELMAEEMSRPVEWAPSLPVACEVKWGSSYGEARR